jgi:hypothetical protein
VFDFSNNPGFQRIDEVFIRMFKRKDIFKRKIRYCLKVDRYDTYPIIESEEKLVAKNRPKEKSLIDDCETDFDDLGFGLFD